MSALLFPGQGSQLVGMGKEFFENYELKGDPNFDVTAEGDIVGIEGVKNHYLNYLTGFSEIEWKIKDAFGQGDRLVKHWNFKGKHTGDFFGIPATGNLLDLSGTTMVTMKDGKIAKEHDFFDMKSMLDQLLSSEGDVVIDEYQPVN